MPEENRVSWHRARTAIAESAWLAYSVPARARPRLSTTRNDRAEGLPGKSQSLLRSSIR